jgi:LysM repeat protein
VGAATPEAPAASTSTHEVQRGESLALIAQKYQVNVNSLVEANVQKYPQLTRNPNVIVVGWVLAIPGQ